MAKDKTPKPNATKPDRGGDTRREGKKSVNWQEDAEILQRLVKTAELMNQNKRAWEIAIATRVSMPTAKLDIARVREMWRTDAKEHILNARDVAIAQYSQIIQQAWDDVKKVKPTNPARAAYHNVIIRAQRQIDSVSGLASKVELVGAGGGPIQHEVVDVEKIRKKRWKDILPSLAEMAAQKAEQPDGSASDNTANTEKPK